MRKSLTVLLTACMTVSLFAGCSGTKTTDNEVSKNSQVAAESEVNSTEEFKRF